MKYQPEENIMNEQKKHPYVTHPKDFVKKELS